MLTDQKKKKIEKFLKLVFYCKPNKGGSLLYIYSILYRKNVDTKERSFFFLKNRYIHMGGRTQAKKAGGHLQFRKKKKKKKQLNILTVFYSPIIYVYWV